MNNPMNNMNSPNGANGAYYPFEITQNRTRNIEIIHALDPTFAVMQNNIDFDSEEFAGSVQQILSGQIGAYTVLEFLIGTAGTTTREGVIVEVGRSYILIFDVRTLRYVICDAFSVKFAYFPLNVLIPVARSSAWGANNNTGNTNNNSPAPGYNSYNSASGYIPASGYRR